MNFQKNNLDKASSPYLQQHKKNPIYWQEWHPQVIDYAKQQNKLILVSVGYATCHWCHVMADDTFQDAATAKFINEHFVPIKVDREQRPDIDQYLMSYAVQTIGTGGWPLNVILTADLKPFAATTYLPSKEDTQMGLASFLQLLNKVVEFYDAHKENISSYVPPIVIAQPVQPQLVLNTIESQFDPVNGGFGLTPKFPPHATLLFLLTVFAQENAKSLYIMLKKTCEAMALGGLQDHLQGGFFRYCIDAQWTIPILKKCWLIKLFCFGIIALLIKR